MLNNMRKYGNKPLAAKVPCAASLVNSWFLAASANINSWYLAASAYINLWALDASASILAASLVAVYENMGVRKQIILSQTLNFTVQQWSRLGPVDPAEMQGLLPTEYEWVFHFLLNNPGATMKQGSAEIIKICKKTLTQILWHTKKYIFHFW